MIALLRQLPMHEPHPAHCFWSITNGIVPPFVDDFRPTTGLKKILHGIGNLLLRLTVILPQNH
jgi:hypothetical protein